MIARFPFLAGRVRPLVMAHRGNRVTCPENTLAAFSQAFKDGADILETDVHLSKDGEFVCIHDATLERTTNGMGRVVEHTLAELKTYSASYGFPGFESEKIPTLNETARILPQQTLLALELKTDRFLEADVCRQLGDILRANNIFTRSVVLSFSAERLKTMQIAEPELPTGWITLNKPFPIQGFELLGPFWLIFLLNPLYVWQAHRRGQFVAPLDPVPDRRLWLYRLLQVDALLTDDPGTTLKKLRG